MTTLTLFTVAILAVVVGVLLFRIIPAMQTYFMYRGKRLVTCPETLETEAVDVAARKAAAWTFVGESTLRLDRCSRWPERQDCGQECLKQVEPDPENCLLWNIVSQWYEGQCCVYCRKRFGPLLRLDDHLDHAPALMGPDHKTVEWSQFRPEQLPELFSTYRPVCWDCHRSNVPSRAPRVVRVSESVTWSGSAALRTERLTCNRPTDRLRSSGATFVIEGTSSAYRSNA